HHPMWRPDSANPAQPDPVPPETVTEAIPLSSAVARIENSAAIQESDFAELAAKLAAHGGGKIPVELSGELALDIVLNEIVEHACLYTGATGAAIALARGEEMVCRATSGGNAPELGSLLDMNSGLSGACVRSRQIQRCDDALADPSADAEVSRQLGVRSVVVLPLLQDEELIGIFEIFSLRPAAFSDGDLGTLEVLAERALKNAQARKSSLVSIGLAPNSSGGGGAGREHATEVSEEQAASEAAGDNAMEYESLTAKLALGTLEAASSPPRRVDWLTLLMSGAIVAVALLMGTVFAMRMGWLKTGQHRAPRVATTASASSALATSAAGRGNPNAGAPGSMTPANARNKSTTGQSGSEENARVPEGSLRVYENGKEIFRMPPSEAGATEVRPGEKDANTDSGLQPASVVELSPDAAEGSLLRRVEPEYPEQALTQRVQGPVLLDVHISQEGAVQEIKLVSGEPLLAEAAIAAVRQWRFKPQTVNGQAVEMETRITLKFTLPTN
ncbi:MAG: TonB family protein, partial [Candidatus Sulfotelmatobacter sp.]